MAQQKWHVHKHGIEWGAAFEEAQPIMLAHGQTIVVETAFKGEDGDYILILPLDAILSVDNDRIRVRVPQAD